MSFERNQSPKTTFEKTIKIVGAVTIVAAGVAALFGANKVLAKSNPSTATQATIAEQTASQDILDQGRVSVVENYNVICGNIGIQDPIVETLKTGNTFYVGINGYTQGSQKMNFLQLAENMVSCQATVPVSSPVTSARVEFNNNGQLTNTDGQVIATAHNLK